MERLLVAIGVSLILCSGCASTQGRSSDGQREIELTSATEPDVAQTTTPELPSSIESAPPPTSFKNRTDEGTPYYRSATPEDDLFCDAFTSIVVGETPYAEAVTQLETAVANTPPEIAVQMDEVAPGMRELIEVANDGEQGIEDLGPQGLRIVEQTRLALEGQPGGDQRIVDVFDWVNRFCYDQAAELGRDLFVTARQIDAPHGAQASPFNSSIIDNIYNDNNLCFARTTDARTAAATLFKDSDVVVLSDSDKHWELSLEPRKVGAPGPQRFEASCSIGGAFQ